jgi:hypothetical protein
MQTAQIDDLFCRLRSGKFAPADIEFLEQANVDELRKEVLASYPCLFQERRLNQKWEFAAARSVGYEVVWTSRQSPLPMGLLVPVLRRCVFCSGYGETVSGIAVRGKLIVRPIRKPFKGMALTSGPGFALDHGPDGWDMQPHSKRTVRLSDEFQQKRGWRFDAFARLFISS